jgi:hypothetical protein
LYYFDLNRIISTEDVPNVTKMFDNSEIAWPEPHSTNNSGISMRTPNADPLPVTENVNNSFGFPNFGTNQMPPPNLMNINNPGLGGLQQGFNPVQNTIDFSNPWSLASVPPPSSGLPVVSSLIVWGFLMQLKL